jgi:DNA invertase Pin-like site-specific DNA recombinase
VVVIYAKGPDGNSLWDYAVRRGWEENVHVVTDLDELTRLVWAGKVEVVLASSLIGLGRSVSYLVELLREFVTRKVTLIIPSQGIDTSKVPGKVFLDTLDAINEFKHSAAVEAINEGLAVAKRRGIKLGRPRTLDAYHGDVARLKAQGLSGRCIARTLGLPVGSVFGILRQSASSTPRRNIEVIKK